MDHKLLQQCKHHGDAPPPTYLKYLKDIKPNPDEWNKDAILYGYKDDNGVLRCVDQKFIEKGKGIVKELITQAASNIFTGRDIIGISLPIRIFEGRSLIERIGDWFGFGPIYLKQAGEIQD